MDSIPSDLWIAAAAHHLHVHWRTLEPAQLEETARELQGNPELCALLPAVAVARWLAPACVEPQSETARTDLWGRFAQPGAVPF
ncbi:MAG: hypothetical protein EOO27_01045 [Comamonadaceae bacterium]|nr:MAG: hypothetical protein EOO27_01045 [Comamonadaceae bacterium]